MEWSCHQRDTQGHFCSSRVPPASAAASRSSGPMKQRFKACVSRCRALISTRLLSDLSCSCRTAPLQSSSFAAGFVVVLFVVHFQVLRSYWALTAITSLDTFRRSLQQLGRTRRRNITSSIRPSLYIGRCWLRRIIVGSVDSTLHSSDVNFSLGRPADRLVHARRHFYSSLGTFTGYSTKHRSHTQQAPIYYPGSSQNNSSEL